MCVCVCVWGGGGGTYCFANFTPNVQCDTHLTELIKYSAYGFASTTSLKFFYDEVCTRHMEMGHLEGSVLITFTSSVFIQMYK